MQALPEEKIQIRAYEMWEEEGRPEGRAEEFWHRASTELAGSSAPAKKPRKSAAAKVVSDPSVKPKRKPAAKKSN